MSGRAEKRGSTASMPILHDAAINKMTVKQLKEELKARGQTRNLRKAELAAKLKRVVRETETNGHGSKDGADQVVAELTPPTSAMSNVSPSNPNANAISIIAVAIFAVCVLYKILSALPSVGECEGISPIWLVRTGLQGKLSPIVDASPDSVEGGLQRLKTCSDVMGRDNGSQVVVAYVALYMFFQAFLVPGPNLLLSVFAGALFPDFMFGTFMVAFSCTTGAVISYYLAHFFMGSIMERTVPERVASFRMRIAANRDNIFFYMLFLRLTPLLPNWFINLSSPVVGVPVSSFAFATLLGQMPMNILYWNCGKTFFDAVGDKSLELVGKKMVGAVALLGVAALLPVLLKSQIQAFEKRMGKSK